MSTDSQRSDPDLNRPEVHASLDRYWRSNLWIMLMLLIIWAAGGLGAGVLIADWLNTFNLPGTGFPLGFWFAHQGSIVIFVLLILSYCLLMNRLDARHREEIDNLKQEEPS